MCLALHRPFAAVLVSAALLSACGGADPAKSLEAAKGHIAKQERAAAVIELKNVLQAQPNLAEARLLLGQVLLDSEDAVGAAVELSKAADLSTPPERVVPLLARAYVRAGQWRKVIELDQTNTLTTPEAIADLKTSTAMAHGFLGAFEKSRIALDAALSADRDHAPAVLMQARELADKGDLDGAMDAVDRVLAKNAADTDTLAVRGDLLLAQGREADALAAWRKVLEIDAGHVAAHVSLIDRALQNGDVAAAETQHAALKKARPRSFQTSLLDARITAQKGDLKVADEKIQQLLKWAPEDRQVLQLAGVVALNRGDLLRAEQHLGKLVQAAPNARRARLMLARVYGRTGEPDKVMAVLQPLLDSRAPGAEALALAGSASMLNGDSKAAEDYLTRAAKANPDNVATRTALVVAGMARGDVDGGIAALEKIAAGDAGVAADTALVSVHVNRRNWDAALKAIDRLAKKQPDRPDPHQLRGRVLLAKRDQPGARAAFEKALAVDAKFFPAIGALAALDVQERKIPAARARLEAVLAADPKNARALLILGEIDLQAGSPPAEAVARFAAAVKAAPSDPVVRRRYVQVLAARPDPKAALVAAQEAVTALPDNFDLQSMLAATLVAAGELNQAVLVYNKLVAQRPKSVPALLGLAEAQLAAKSIPGADEAVNKALKLAPTAYAPIQTAVKIDLVAQRRAQALKRARELQKSQPKEPHGWLLEGDIGMATKDWDLAAAAFRNALGKQPGTPTALRLHAALRNAGGAAKADAFAAEWTRTKPDDAQFWFHLSSASIAAKQYDRAEAQLGEVLRVAPDSAPALNNLAWVLVTQRKAGALELARRANELAPNQPVFMDTLSLALAAGGSPKDAVASQRRALALSPEAHELRLNLVRFLLQAGERAEAAKELDQLAKLGEKFAGQDRVRELRAQLEAR